MTLINLLLFILYFKTFELHFFFFFFFFCVSVKAIVCAESVCDELTAEPDPSLGTGLLLYHVLLLL